MYFAGYDLQIISHYVSKVFLLVLVHGFQAIFFAFPTFTSENIFWPRQGNHVMHDTSLVELLCKIRRYSSKLSFTYLVGRFLLLIEEVRVKKSNLASATL